MHCAAAQTTSPVTPSSATQVSPPSTTAQGFAACPGCALVSRELLRRCQAEARDPENPVELLTLAAKLSRNHVCLPLALAHYERDICAEDVWSDGGSGYSS